MGEALDNFLPLTRGGYLVKTSLGPIQIGIPPETIKDTMIIPGGVPQYFVIPDDMFDWGKGISVAEVEFPIFYNFFIRKRKTFLICREDQYKALRNVLQESVFGPKEVNVSSDYPDGSSGTIPNLAREMSFSAEGSSSRILSLSACSGTERSRTKG